MKKINLFKAMALMMVIALVTSCGKSSGSMEEYLCEGNFISISFDAVSIMENAGFKFSKNGIETPGTLKTIMGPSADEFSSTLSSLRGIDPRSIVLTISNEGYDMDVAMLIKVDDQDAFIKSVEGMGLTKSNIDGKPTFEVAPRMAMCVDNDVAVIMQCPVSDMADAMAALRTKAAEKPMPTWQREMLFDGKSSTMIIGIKDATDISALFGTNDTPDINSYYDRDISNGYAVIETEIKGPKVEMDAFVVDADGKKATNKTAGKIDKGMLKYTSAPQFVAMLFGINMNDDVRSILNKLVDSCVYGESATVIKHLLSVADGKMMVAFGTNSIRAIDRGDFSNVWVVKCAKGKGQEAMSVIKDLLNDSPLTYSEVGNVLTVKTPDLPACIKLDGDNVVIGIGHGAADGTGVFSSGDFDGSSVAVYCKVPANSPSLTYVPLPFGIELKVKGDDDDSELSLTLTDTKDNFLDAILKTIAQY